jgi:hypothetical protein
MSPQKEKKQMLDISNIVVEKCINWNKNKSVKP